MTMGKSRLDSKPLNKTHNEAVLIRFFNNIEDVTTYNAGKNILEKDDFAYLLSKTSCFRACFHSGMLE